MTRGATLGLFSALFLFGCTEWLSVSEPPLEAGLDEVTELEDYEGLPSNAGSMEAKGKLIPRTPGLRVPSGYHTHARLDSADFLLEHTWAAFDPTRSPGSQPAPRITLRLVATGEVVGGSRPESPSVRAVFPLALPKGAQPEDLVGLTIREEGLKESRVGIRTSADHHWIVTPTRLSIDHVTPQAIKGSFEGPARRGLKSDRVRVLRAGFTALRAPVR